MSTDRANTSSAASFGSIFEASPQPMLVVEPNANRIADANRAACRLLGYDQALLRSLKFTDLHPGQRPALIVFTQAVMAKGTFWSHSLSARHATGETLMAARRALLSRRRAAEPAYSSRRGRRHLRRERRGQDHVRQSGGRAHARLDRRGAGRA